MKITNNSPLPRRGRIEVGVQIYVPPHPALSRQGRGRKVLFSTKLNGHLINPTPTLPLPLKGREIVMILSPRGERSEGMGEDFLVTKQILFFLTTGSPGW